MDLILISKWPVDFLKSYEMRASVWEVIQYRANNVPQSKWSHEAILIDNYIEYVFP